MSELSRMHHFLSLFLPEVPQLDAPPSGHTAEGARLDVPVFDGVGKQADSCVEVLLVTGPDGAEIVDSHTADFVAMEENHLNRQRGFTTCTLEYESIIDDESVRCFIVTVFHLEVAQGAEARWDLPQTVVVQVDLTDVWDGSKTAIFYRLDLVKSES